MEDIKVLEITDEIIEILIGEGYLPEIPRKNSCVFFLDKYYKIADYTWETQNPYYYGFVLTKIEKIPHTASKLCDTCFEIIVEAAKYGLTIENCRKIKIHDFVGDINEVYIQGWEEYLTIVVRRGVN